MLLFKEATKLVSCDNVAISVTISVVSLLYQTQHGIIDRTVDFLYPDAVSVRLQQVHEEEYDCCDGVQD